MESNVNPIYLYLNLLKKALSFSLYDESFTFADKLPKSTISKSKNLLFKLAYPILKKRNIRLVKMHNMKQRDEGKIWPSLAHTMIGVKRLDNIQYCIEDVIKNNIPGDFVETGVWQGGACILMRGILKAYNITDRKVFVADSFEGLPKPEYREDSGDTHHTFGDVLAVSKEQVEDNFRKYDLLDEQVIFLKGWFKDTLLNAPINKLAILRLDGDMYGSTMDAFISLYSKLSKGGYCIIDDYYLPNCKRAVDDYRKENNITSLIIKIDSDSVYWKK